MTERANGNKSVEVRVGGGALSWITAQTAARPSSLFLHSGQKELL